MPREMRWMTIGIGLAPMALAVPIAAAERGDDAWISKIRKDHPRLFFNADTWPAVKARALGVNRDHLERIRQYADSVTDEPEPRDWGDHLMSAAFVYRVTAEAARLEKIKKMLRPSLAV